MSLFDRKRITFIVAISLFFAVTLTVTLINFFGQEVYETASVTNLLLSVLYVLTVAAFMGFAGLRSILSLVRFGRIWCLLSMLVLIGSAIAYAASLSLSGPVAIAVQVIVIVFAMPFFGFYLIIGNSVALDFVAFLLMLFLCFVPEISQAVYKSHKVRRQLKNNP